MARTVKESACHAGDAGSIPGSGRSLGQEDTLEKEMATHSNILALEIHGQRSLVGYSPRGGKESETTKQLTHSTLSYLQYDLEI